MFSNIGVVVKIERPQMRKAISSTIHLDSYEQIAKDLGFFPAELLDRLVRQFLLANDIPIYDHGEVDRYLRQQAVTSPTWTVHHVWIWVHLRRQDETNEWGSTNDHGSYRPSSSSYQSGSFMSEPYT